MGIKTREIDALSGSVMKKLLQFSLPLILTNWLHLLFNSVDSMVVGHWAGSLALAAVGTTFPIVMTTVSLFGGLSVGVTVCAANDYGARDEQGYRDTVHTAVPVAFIVGLVVMLLGVIFTRAPLKLISVPADVIDDSELYLRIYFLSIPGHMLYEAGASALRARGDSQNPLKFLLISGFVNVLLNLLFVIAFNMSVAGVAIATVMSRYLSVVLVFTHLRRPDSPCRVSIKEMCIHRDKLRKIIRVGLPAGLQSAMLASSDLPLQSAVNSMGSMATSGNAAVLNLDGFIFTTMDATGQACTVFTGQSAGAGKYDRASSVFRCSLLITVLVGIILGGICFVFRRPLIGLFVPGETEAIEYGAARCNIVTTTTAIYAFLITMNASLRGYGSSTVPAIITVLGLSGFRFMWAKFFVPTHRTMVGIYLSYPVAWILCIIVTALLYRTLVRRAREKMEQSKAQ